MKKSALTLAERQPLAIRAAVVGAVTAVVHVLVVVGLVPADLEDPIAGAVDAVGLAVLVLVAARSVTPNAKVVTRVTTDGNVVAGDAAAAPTGATVPVIGGDPEVAVVGTVAVQGRLVA